MVISIDSLKEPIGSIKPWIRPNTSTPLPINWLICDGSTVADSASPFNTLAIPDYRAKFVRGHNSLTNANFGSDATYFTGGTIPSGGADTVNLLHSHTDAGGHTHTDLGHTHTQGNHHHGLRSGLNATLSAPNGSPSNVNNSSPLGLLTLSGATQDSSDTGNGSSGVGSTASGTASIQAASIAVNNALSSSSENRPAFAEYLHIIKIK